MNKYYKPVPKIKITCRHCQTVFLGILTQKFCSFKCKNSFNEKKIRERNFVKKYYYEIRKILGDNCSCNEPSVNFHHKTYDIPVRKINYDNRKKYNVTKEKINKMLIEYCKYLEPLCHKCHDKITNYN